MSDNYRVELSGISKSFGGVDALRDVSLKAEPGEIHALVGENGAGKSTLMKILSGACPRDTGTISIDNNFVEINNPHDGRESGIGIIYQELSLVPDLSVAENIYLYKLSRQNRWISWKKIRSDTKHLISSMGFDISPAAMVRQLSIARQQVVEIAKALSENVSILILDEPTAVLAPGETSQLFDVLLRLKKAGVSILYISHRLEEVFRISDSITILKDGQVTGSIKTSETTQDEIINLMIGRRLSTFYPARIPGIGEDMFRAEDLGTAKKLKNISFSVKSGEVLGITGLVGSGRTETLRAIFGADKRESGSLYLRDKALRIRSPRDAVQAGIGLVPEDRKTQGIILSMSLMENTSMPDTHSVSGPLGIINRKRERNRTGDLVNRLAIKTKSLDSVAAHLSGGNQQKLVLAKWLGKRCSVLFLDEPTRGVDVGAKQEIYQLINQLSAEGLAIVMVSSEMAEVMGMCDRILVMKEGEIRGELGREEFSEENILRLSI